VGTGRISKAILVVSGHWEEADIAVMSDPAPPVVYGILRLPKRVVSDRLSDSGSPALANHVSGFSDHSSTIRVADDPKVVGLVYIIAFAADKGESVATLIKDPPPGAPVPPILPPQDGNLFLDRAEFRASFAADVDAERAAFMADSQVPWGVEALSGKVSEPAWKAKPSWYLIATDDKMIPPDAQRSMSKRHRPVNKRHNQRSSGNFRRGIQVQACERESLFELRAQGSRFSRSWPASDPRVVLSVCSGPQVPRTAV
jgi:hypothetical protein